MRVDSPMISYHSLEGGKSDRIMSVDCHPDASDGLVTFATVGGGGEGDVRLWSLAPDAEAPVYRSSLRKGHDGSVNCARWSPDGAKLCSAGDRGTVCVWSGQSTAAWWRGLDDRDERATCGHLSHSDDVYDGVAWDPLGTCFATASSDRTVKVYALPDKWAASKKPSRRRRSEIAHASFFRRLQFAADGTALVAAAAARGDAQGAAALLRDGLDRGPFAFLASPEGACGARACPCSSARGARPRARAPLPRRLRRPRRPERPALAVGAGGHYAALTDGAWAPDGSRSSSRPRAATCRSRFDPGELGERVDAPRPAAAAEPAAPPANDEAAPGTPRRARGAAPPRPRGDAAASPKKKRIAPTLLAPPTPKSPAPEPAPEPAAPAPAEPDAPPKKKKRIAPTLLVAA
ncbi:hypothetical protein JL722_11318 [Aureococcus anophagefferens]|nr:hypothetical protein JL722_11318 [Aureococcus anophagefferens]